MCTIHIHMPINSTLSSARELIARQTCMYTCWYISSVHVCIPTYAQNWSLCPQEFYISHLHIICMRTYIYSYIYIHIYIYILTLRQPQFNHFSRPFYGLFGRREIRAITFFDSDPARDGLVVTATVTVTQGASKCICWCSTKIVYPVHGQGCTNPFDQ